MKRNLALLILLSGVLQAQMHDHSSPADGGETTQARIARALSAGPPEIAKSARVIDTHLNLMLDMSADSSDGRWRRTYSDGQRAEIAASRRQDDFVETSAFVCARNHFLPHPRRHLEGHVRVLLQRLDDRKPG